MKNLNIIYFILLGLGMSSCNPQKPHDSYNYPSGNSVQDYFYKKGFSFPFYCDSLKPVCKAADTLKYLGKFAQQKVRLATQACTIIRQQFNTDSLLRSGDVAFTVFPVFVYYIDSPIVWYRVVFKEYRNNNSHENKAPDNWQLIDSNRVLAYYHNLEFLVNEDGTLEYKCDQM